jgi:hypothetical protein
MTQPLQILLDNLRSLKPELRARFGVNRVAIFGSHARGEATETSDLDLLIGFAEDARPTLFTLSDMDALLEQHLGIQVDTVPDTCINPRIESYIRANLREV